MRTIGLTRLGDVGKGITLSGFKFMTIKADPDEAIGRKGVSLLFF